MKLYSCHSTSASVVDSGSSRNKDDALSAKVFFAFLPTRPTQRIYFISGTHNLFVICRPHHVIHVYFYELLPPVS